MSSWTEGEKQCEFTFDKELFLCFRDEDYANKVKEWIFEGTEIETQVVKIGNPPTNTGKL